VYHQLTNNEISDEDVKTEIQQAELEKQHGSKFLAQIAGNLNDNGKAIVVKAAFLVALADGKLHDEERKALATVGSTLQMESAKFNQVIDSMLEDR
jgi:tellurite resistance protein